MKMTSNQLASSIAMYLYALLTLLPLVAGLETNILDKATNTLNANLTQKHRSTSSITITWVISPIDLYTISEFHIYYHKEDSHAISRTFPIPNNATQYQIKHLVRDSKFIICLVATHVDLDGSNRYEKTCGEFSTIPFMRSDSIAALIITILYVTITFLAAYIVWRKRKSEYEQEKNLAESERKSVGSTGSKADANQSNYLLPPEDKKRPRLSIEDPKYITPPASKVSEDEDHETSLVRT